MTLIYNAVFDKNTRKLTFEDKAGNEIYSFTVPERGPAVDDITKPLTFRATQDGSSVTLTSTGYPIGDFQTSRDGGNTWVDYTLDTAITLNTGEEVSFRAKADRTYEQSNQRYFYFEMTGKIEAWHNVMSLYRTNDFATYESVVRSAFYKLFSGCTSLTKAPALPATTLYIDCYQSMFEDCTSLTKTPALQATTLGSYCYDKMFSGCSSLNEVHCKVPSSYSSSDSSYWLYDVAQTGTFYTNADANWPSGSSGIPEGWTRVNEEAPAVDDVTKPLTLRATQDGSTIKLTKKGSPSGSFQTSNDGGNTWADYTLGTAISLNTGDEVSFRAKSNRTSEKMDEDYFSFEMTGKIEAWHNVMSMTRTNDFATFKGLVNYAFNGLFYRCTSLTKAPVLPATTLSKYCYTYMFYGCTSLKEAPELPATTLASYANNCYSYMFALCTSLTKTPELPATTLSSYCYTHMFYGCSSLNEVRCQMPSSYKISDIPSYTGNAWLKGVSSTGKFYTNADAHWPLGEDSGIPQNWTRLNIDDYPTT